VRRGEGEVPVRVAVYHSNSDVRVEERPVPRVGAGELLVKVWASGICGSDVMEWYRAPRAPLVLGHEIGGEVVKAGKGVKGFRVGDRVFVSHHVPCEECHYCERDHATVCDLLRKTNFDPGGFAEFVRVPAVNAKLGTYKLPDSMSYEEAVFIEPLGCVYRGQRRAGLREGDSVLVMGAGLAGLLHIKLDKAMGASRIMATDVLKARRKAALRSGADEAFDAKGDVHGMVREANDGRLADLVVVATGAKSALGQALDCVDRGGTVLFFAPTDPAYELPIPFNRVWANEVSIVTTYGASPKDLEAAIKLISSGRVTVKDMVTHRLPLSRIQEGFDLTANPVDSLKVIIEPQR